MTASGKSRHDLPLENSMPAGAVPLESILCTEEFQRRPSRPPDYEKENRALVKLVGALDESPSRIFQTLAETILDITQCDSAGLSLLTKDGKTPHACGERFYWPAIAGMWKPHVGGGTPRNFGPCGDVLDQNRTLLFRHFERRYPYSLRVSPTAEECLLVPFHVAGIPVGTIWAIMHSDRRKFDDLSEQKRGEIALRRSKAFLAEAQHLSRIGSFSWRVATDEITWSEQLYRIYELEIGVPVTLEVIRTRVHPEDVSLLEEMVDQARGGASDFEWQYRLIMPDHSIKYLHAVAHATRDQDGQLEYIAAVQDVTAHRLSEQAHDKVQSDLAHMARVMSLGALTASIAHEVNQPLSGIITNASTCLRMLGANPPNIDGAIETARRTIRDGHRASDVITRLRSLFAKKGAATEPVHLNEATREVLALSSSEFQRNRVMVRPELADDLPPVTGDRVQLEQVILNLIRNASDALTSVEDRPRQLMIRTQRDADNCVRLTVQDTGVGFGPEAMDRLFNAFYTTKSDGIGIGLFVSRSIIEHHRGHLWAAPNDDGPGATFSFSIPGSHEPVKRERSLSDIRTPAFTPDVSRSP